MKNTTYIICGILMSTSIYAKTVNECKQMEQMWQIYDDMAGKAFLKELDIAKSVKLKVLALDTVEDMLKNCPDAYWETYNEGLPRRHTVEYWKEGMDPYIQKSKLFIEKHINI